MMPLKYVCLFLSLNNNVPMEATTKSVNPIGLFNRLHLSPRYLIQWEYSNIMPRKIGSEYKKHWIEMKVMVPSSSTISELYDSEQTVPSTWRGASASPS